MSKNYKCSNHKVFTIEEEFHLFEQYHASNDETEKEKIRNTIIEHNIKFAIAGALVYVKRWNQVDPNDLKGYAVLGMIEAFDSFDHTRNVKFSSYASWWVKCTINRNVECNESLIRYPSNKHRELYKHFKESDVEKDDTLNDFDSMSCNIFGGMSLDQPIENTDMKLEDTISDPSNVESEFIMSETINNALKKLTPVQRKVIEGIYGFENGEKKTVREIAYELDTSHENVRNIRNKALRILEKLNSKGLL